MRRKYEHKKIIFLITALLSIPVMAQQADNRAKASNGTVNVVDEQGKLYIKRHYKGVVPGIKDVSDVPSKKNPPKTNHPVVEWVGFQPFKDYSRVFVQINGQFSFTVTKTDKQTIQILIPNATVATRNDARELVTFKFPSQVNMIKTIVKSDNSGRTVLIRIFLKKDVGYLFRQDGKYIFVDVENPH